MMNAPAVSAIESNSHFNCCRSSPWDRRYRIVIDAIAHSTPPRNTNITRFPAARIHVAPSIPAGFGMPG